MLKRFNFLKGKLASSIDSNDLSVEVTTSLEVVLDVADYFYIVLDYNSKNGDPEIVKVTNISDSTYTIERGQLNTTARAHSVNTMWANAILAEDFEDIENNREIELQSNDISIQWRYVGDNDWVDLVDLADLTGPQGPSGVNGKTILNGAGSPVSGTGTNGDFYLQTGPSPLLYGPKASGSWPDPIILKGEPGQNGDDGEPGEDGESAYELAVENGFIGTVQEWLTSLIGNPAEPLSVVATVGLEGGTGLNFTTATLYLPSLSNNSTQPLRWTALTTIDGPTIQSNIDNLGPINLLVIEGEDVGVWNISSMSQPWEFKGKPIVTSAFDSEMEWTYLPVDSQYVPVHNLEYVTEEQVNSMIDTFVDSEIANLQSEINNTNQSFERRIATQEGIAKIGLHEGTWALVNGPNGNGKVYEHPGLDLTNGFDGDGIDFEWVGAPLWFDRSVRKFSFLEMLTCPSTEFVDQDNPEYAWYGVDSDALLNEGDNFGAAHLFHEHCQVDTPHPVEAGEYTPGRMFSYMTGSGTPNATVTHGFPGGFELGIGYHVRMTHLFEGDPDEIVPTTISGGVWVKTWWVRATNAEYADWTDNDGRWWRVVARRYGNESGSLLDLNGPWLIGVNDHGEQLVRNMRLAKAIDNWSGNTLLHFVAADVDIDGNIEDRASGNLWVPSIPGPEIVDLTYSSYVQAINSSSSLELGESSSTAYRGDRGKTAYDHSQTIGNPHGVTAIDVGADPEGTADGAITAHTSSIDPHGDRAYANALVDDLSGVSNLSVARNNLGLGTSSVLNAPASGDASSGEIVKGNDTRLSDARTPTAHSHSASDIASGTIAIERIPTGATSTTVALGDDSRLSDSRTPTAHASTHLPGSSDPITSLLSRIASPPAVNDWFTLPYSAVTTSATTLNRLTYIPVWIPSGVNQIDALGFEVTTVASAGGVVRMGLYTRNSTTGRPDVKIGETSTIDTTATVGTGWRNTSLTSAVSVTPDSIIFVGFVAQVANVTCRIPSTGEFLRHVNQPSSTLTDMGRQGTSAGWIETATGALPATATPTLATNASGVAILVAMRRSS